MRIIAYWDCSGHLVIVTGELIKSRVTLWGIVSSWDWCRGLI